MTHLTISHLHGRPLRMPRGNMGFRYLMVLHGKRENPIHNTQQDHDLGEIETSCAR